MTIFLSGVKAAIVGALAAVASAVVLGQSPASPGAYMCPMHPDVVSRVAGSCPRCRMTLVAADPFDAREFVVDMRATPAARRATRLRLTVREPASGGIVRDFVDVHEKPYHLFVVSADLEHYDHVHPQQRADGSFGADVVFPRPGVYRLYSDFLPLGGMPQVIPRTFVTPGFNGTLASQRARLAPDGTRTKIVGGLRVTLTLPPDGLVAGRDETLHYRIDDAASGAPVEDLEPYLAAFGHTLLLTEDMLHYVHAHPVELPPDAGARGDDRRRGGGPDLTFKALLPKPGRYRIWTQLKRGGTVSTVSFTVAAASPVK